MRGSRLAAALLGLGAVQALPAKTTVEERAAQIFGPPGSSFSPGDPPRAPRPPCNPDTDRMCFPRDDPPRSGLRPGKRDTVPLPPSTNQYRRDIIASLQSKLAGLESKPAKTAADEAEMKTLRQSVSDLAAIAWLTASSEVKISTLDTDEAKTKRWGPVDEHKAAIRDLERHLGANTKRWDPVEERKAAIRDLERRLEALQNKPDKSRDDWDEIHDLRYALRRLVGITDIDAPPGTVTTFTPGRRNADTNPNTNANAKRQVLILPPSGGTSRADCPSIDIAERELQRLEDSLRRARVRGGIEELAVLAFEQFLRSCGMRLEQDDDGYAYISHSSSPEPESEPEPEPEPEEGEYYGDDAQELSARDNIPADDTFDPAGLREALDALLAALGDAAPAYPTFLVVQRLQAALAARLGASAENLPALPTLQSRQAGIIGIGDGACQLADVLALKAALAALATAYGHPSSAPPTIFLVEQVIVSALQICHQDVPGWTTLTPGNPLPGGPMVPEKPIPGGPMVPEKPTPGGPLVPEKPTPGGGPLVPEKPTPGGGPLVPEKPTPGGPVVPENPTPGGPLVPEKPTPGGPAAPDRPA